MPAIIDGRIIFYTLEYVYYVSNIRYNLISIGLLKGKDSNYVSIKNSL